MLLIFDIYKLEVKYFLDGVYNLTNQVDVKLDNVVLNGQRGT